MKKINYKLNEYNKIVSYSEIPFDERKPFVEVPDNQKIIIGFSSVANGKFYSNEATYNSFKKLKKELKEIQLWLKDNDWKVNKFTLGEWTEDDPRWIQYKYERKIKRERQDYIKGVLNNG